MTRNSLPTSGKSPQSLRSADRYLPSPPGRSRRLVEETLGSLELSASVLASPAKGGSPWRGGHGALAWRRGGDRRWAGNRLAGRSGHRRAILLSRELLWIRTMGAAAPYTRGYGPAYRQAPANGYAPAYGYDSQGGNSAGANLPQSSDFIRTPRLTDSLGDILRSLERRCPSYVRDMVRGGTAKEQFVEKSFCKLSRSE